LNIETTQMQCDSIFYNQSPKKSTVFNGALFNAVLFYFAGALANPSNLTSTRRFGASQTVRETARPFTFIPLQVAGLTT